MEISARIGEDNVEIRIFGKAMDYDSYAKIKKIIRDNMENIKSFRFYFINANSIEPRILGYILNLREIGGLEISIIVSNARLYDFLKNIEFHNFFDVKIKEYE